MSKKPSDLLWENICVLPYFRGFLRAVEGVFYQEIVLKQPILDLGTGDGFFSSITFANKLDVGIDPSFSELRSAKNLQGTKSNVCGMGNSLPFRNDYFGTIISNSVLEHIEDLPPVLKEINRVLPRHGMLIITVPNSNFTENLSIGRFLKWVGAEQLAIKYQYFFNKISRHYHPDPAIKWEERLIDAGFDIEKKWNYFSRKSLSILEWGHLFGMPAWVSKKVFGRWIIFQKKWNLWPVYFGIKKSFLSEQKMINGAYSMFIAHKAE